MFEDVGKKIKKVAEGYFITLTIIGIITGIVFFFIAADARKEEVWIISGLATMVITPFVAWLSSLILYGFGEIVDTAIINRNGSCANIEHPQESKTVSAIVQPQQTVEEEPEPEEVDVVAQAAETGLCPKCGDKLYMNNSYCSKCGEFFAKSVL